MTAVEGVTVTDKQKGIYTFRDQIFSLQANIPKKVEEITEFEKFYPDDVLVYTYPKAGTHFLADVIGSLYQETGLIPDGVKENELQLLMELPSKYDKEKLSFEEIAERTPRPRILCSHLAWNILPKQIQENGIKIIHCIRNPKDVACSFYPFIKKVGILQEDTTWEEFLSIFINGKCQYGGYFEFMKKWYPYRNSPNQLVVYYEDMKQDLSAVVKQVAGFLNVPVTDEQVAQVVSRNTFENVKARNGNTVFLRQGTAGSWKSQFTDEQNKEFDAWIEKELAGLPGFQLKFD